MSRDSKVFIGNVPSDCRESDIENFFRGIGEVRDIVLKNNYGFCEFVDYYDAKDAVKEKDGERLLGVRVRVEFSKGERGGGGGGGGSGSGGNGGGGNRGGDRSCVYVGNIPNDCREQDITSFFQGFGRIKQVMLKRGFAFAMFEDERDAEDAVRDMSGKKLRGERVKLEFAKGEKRGSDRDRYEGGSGYRVRVDNLSSSTAWQDLKDYMKQAGEVLYCKAHHDRQGEGMCEFQKRGDMEWAMDKLDNTELDGRRIRISMEGGGSGGGSGGGGGGRGGGGRGRDRDRSRTRSRSRS